MEKSIGPHTFVKSVKLLGKIPNARIHEKHTTDKTISGAQRKELINFDMEALSDITYIYFLSDDFENLKRVFCF